MSATAPPGRHPPPDPSTASTEGTALIPAIRDQLAQAARQQQQPQAQQQSQEQLQLQQHQQQPGSEIQTMGDESRSASWDTLDEPKKFPQWCCFLDPKRTITSGAAGCKKDCCYPNGECATKTFADIQEPADRTDRAVAQYEAKLFAARLKDQRSKLKQIFSTLKAFPTAADATVSTWLGESVEPPLEYAPTTVAQGILTRAEFRWFAGYNQSQLEELRTSEAVHPSILPAVLPHSTNFRCHTINALHMKSDVVPLQKFVLLATGGKIVFDHHAGNAEETDSKAKFEKLVYVTWPPAIKGVAAAAAVYCEEKHPLNWDKHAAACENFYKDAVVGNHCAPYIQFVQKLEGDGLCGSVLKAVQAMPINQLQSRAQGVIDATPANSTATGKRARQVEFDALPDYSTETGLTKAAAKLWREQFTGSDFYDDSKEKKRKREEEEAQNKVAKVAAGSSSASAAADSQSLTTPGCSFQVIKGILEVFKVTTEQDLIKNCTDAQIHALHDVMLPLFSRPTQTSGLFKKGLAKAVMNDIETLFQWKL